MGQATPPTPCNLPLRKETPGHGGNRKGGSFLLEAIVTVRIRGSADGLLNATAPAVYLTKHRRKLAINRELQYRFISISVSTGLFLYVFQGSKRPRMLGVPAGRRGIQEMFLPLAIGHGPQRLDSTIRPGPGTHLRHDRFHELPSELLYAPTLKAMSSRKRGAR